MTRSELKKIYEHICAVMQVASAIPNREDRNADICVDPAVEYFLQIYPDSPIRKLVQ